MDIQEATVEDIPVINKLARSIWPVAYRDIISPAQMEYMLQLFYSAYSLQDQMQKQGHTFLILYDNVYGCRMPAGFASFSKLPAIDSTYRLHKLYVLPRTQGKGAGRFLLSHIIQMMRRQGASFLELNVNRNNAAQYFYHKMGFSIVKEEDIDIGHGYFMNDYVMQMGLQ